MADPFVAEIRIFPYNFPPRHWAWCDGGLMPISQNTALFALLGTTYGGDGRSTFALPDMRGAAPMQPDTFQNPGPGLSSHDLGEAAGTPFLTLLESEIPLHSHAVNGSNGPANIQAPGADRVLGRAGVNVYQDNPSNLVQMAPQSLATAGGSLPHNNLMPYLTFHFNIALQGVFPQRP